jgi:hypothetical protein
MPADNDDNANRGDAGNVADDGDDDGRACSYYRRGAGAGTAGREDIAK